MKYLVLDENQKLHQYDCMQDALTSYRKAVHTHVLYMYSKKPTTPQEMRKYKEYMVYHMRNPDASCISIDCDPSAEWAQRDALSRAVDKLIGDYK